MINLKNIMMTAVICLTTASFASAQDGSALTFVRIDRNPVSAGMGFAGAASSRETAYSSFRNSSVIPFATERLSVGASGQIWAPNGAKSTNLAFGSAFKAGKRLGFSVGGAYQMGEEYTSFDETGNAAGTFKPGDIVLNAGAGFLILDNLSVGANVRYASQKLSSDNSYSAISTDVFLTYRLSGLNITAGVSSLGSSVKSVSGDSFSLPASATVGAEWSKAFSETHGVRLAADADYFFSGNFTAAAGAEYSFKNMLFARAGYHFGTKDAVLPSFATVGLGVRFFGISLNVAYLTANDTIGNTLTLGLGYRF